ncbi:MAG: DUF4124 domain-containing protein, partial [Rubrivivax sp.]
MKMMMRVLAVGLVAGAGVGEAQVYKWTDASGKVHYGDKKEAEGARQQELKIKLPPVPPPTPPAPVLAPEFRASA